MVQLEFCETVSTNNSNSPSTDPGSFYVDEDVTCQEMELDTPIDLSTGVPQMVSTQGDKINLEEE